MVADTGNRQFQLFCVTPGVFPLQRFTNSRLMDAQIAVAKTAVKIVYLAILRVNVCTFSRHRSK